ncbi:MAG: TolC family protein [Acidobacteria bacterium]|nr:TolC family protein [Acidobacteriota bacterium]
MRRVVLRAALVMAVLVPSGAGGQSLMLTESDALARLSAGSPRVRAIRAGIDVARVDILSAGRRPNPRVNWDRQSVSGVTEHYVTVSQLLPTSGRRGLEVQAASARAAAASGRVDDEVRRLRADLRLAFADLEAAQQRSQELLTARDRLRELARILATRESEGDAAGFDRLRVEREVLDVEADLVIATTERTRAQATLAGFFDAITDPSGIVAVPRGAALAPVPSVAALMETAETSRGDLLALGQDLEAARLSSRAAYRSLIPEPEIFVGTKSSTATGGSAGSAITIGTQATGSVIGVHATIPLFDRARPERTLAAAKAAQAEAEAEAFRVALRGQAVALRAAVIERREGADRYRTEAVNRADEIERIARVSYDAGERGILELLDAFRSGTSARVRQATLDLAVRQAEIEIEFATGWETL